MPPALPAIDLKSITGPTPEEVEQAKKIIAAGGKNLKSKMQSMRTWLQKNPDPKVQGAEGDEKQRYLESFIIVQLRARDTTKTTDMKKMYAKEHESVKFWEWLCKKQMDDKLGEKKAQGWRDSKKLRDRPDTVTGSTEEDMMEWRCPLDWEKFAETSTDSFGLHVVGDASEGDVALVADMQASHGDAASSSDLAKAKQEPGQPLVPVKLEPKTPEQIQEHQYQCFLGNTAEKTRHFQEMQVNSQWLLRELSKDPYSEALQADIKKFATRIGGLVKLLLRAQTEDIGRPGYHKLSAAMEQMEKMNEKLERHSEKFGVKIKKKNKKSSAESSKKRRMVE